MSAPPTLSLVLRRARAFPAPVAAVAVNVLVVCVLVSGLVASLTLLQQEALASTLDAEPPDRTVVSVSSPYDDEDPAGQDRAIRDALQPVVAVAGGEVVTVVATGTHDVLGRGTALVLAAVAGDGGRLRAGTGRLPEPSGSEVLEVAAPPGSGLAPGDTVTLRNRADGRRVRAAVTGTWAVDTGDERWLADLGPDALVVPAEQVGEVAGSGTQARWRAVPSTADLDPAALPALAAAVGTATTELQVAATRLSGTVTADSDLVEVIGDRARELTVLRALLLVPAGLLVLVAAAGLVLVAAGLAGVRREEEGLLRSRGANQRQLVLPTVTETLLICGAAALVAPLLATGLVRIGDVRPPLDPAAWVGSAVAAAVCAAALSVPVVVRATTGDRGQQQSVERQRRRLLTGLLALSSLVAGLGLLAVVTLRGFGDTVGSATGASATVDPLLVSAPALLLLALAVLASLALLPPLFRLVAGVLGSRGVALSLGARFAARAPAASVPLALTVALATGVLAFAAIERDSSATARQVRADHVAGADVRVLTPPSAQRAGVAEEGAVLRALPGVERVTAVHRAETYVDDLPTEVVVAGVSAATSPDLLGENRQGWREVVARPWAGEAVGVAVPVGTERLTVRLDVAGRGATDSWLTGPDGEVLVVPGRLRRGTATVELPEGDGFRLVAVRTDLGTDTGAPGDAGPGNGPPQATVRADGVPLATDAHWFAPDRIVHVTFGPEPLEVPETVPVVMTEELAAAASLETGDTLTLPVLGIPTQVELVATVPALRTVVGAGGVLADAGTALPTLLANGFGDDPDEWWLAVDDDEAAQVGAGLADHPDVAADVVTRRGVLDQLAADPSTGGAALGQVLLLTGSGCLVVGALLLFSVVLLRRPEHAEQARRIGAAGGDRRLLVGVLGWEYAVTTGAGVATGLVAGGTVAAVTLVSMTLGPDGDPLVPAPELLVPWVPVLSAPLLMVLPPLLAMVWLTRRRHGHGLGALDRERGGR